MKILVIDDDFEIRSAASMILTRMGGHEVVEADSGVTGLQAAQLHVPDVILLDVMLGDADGRDVSRQLRAVAATRDIPVIFITGLQEADDPEHWEDLGALGVIGKPFNPLTLHEEIDRLIS